MHGYMTDRQTCPVHRFALSRFVPFTGTSRPDLSLSQVRLVPFTGTSCPDLSRSRVRVVPICPAHGYELSRFVPFTGSTCHSHRFVLSRSEVRSQVQLVPLTGTTCPVGSTFEVNKCRVRGRAHKPRKPAPYRAWFPAFVFRPHLLRAAPRDPRSSVLGCALNAGRSDCSLWRLVTLASSLPK